MLSQAAATCLSWASCKVRKSCKVGEGLISVGILAGSCSCPAAADLAADLAELIMLHSEFQPLMTQRSEEPLPTAAAQLAAPLASLLPLVSIHPGSQQQVSAQPCTI